MGQVFYAGLWQQIWGKTYRRFRKGCATWSLLFFPMALLVGCEKPAQDESNSLSLKERLIIQCAGDCTNAQAALIGMGADVTRRYRNVDALAAELPVSKIAQLNSLTSVKSYKKDQLIRNPTPRAGASYSLGGLDQVELLPLSLAQVAKRESVGPRNYLINNIKNGVATLHQQDISGQGVVVAVIDSGIANNPEVVPALAGTVIGGKNFVMGDAEPSATSTQNEPHGTMVGGMIAALLSVVLPNDDPLLQSVMMHTPESVIVVDETSSAIPMVGTAPGASLYAVKVFGIEEVGAPTSRVLAAMDHILSLKHNFNAGQETSPSSGDGSEDDPFQYEALNVQVVNLSLGTPTLFPGNSVEDLLALKMLEAGIVVVAAAGNEGFGAMTNSSPASSVGALSVGAANSPVHERILRDMQFEAGAGKAFRANELMQTAFFSSRGPNANGRLGLDVVANGMASFTQRADGGLSLVSGTSFSSPTVAGAAALLWQATAGKEVTASDIRAALIQSANPSLLDNPGDSKIDRGMGYLDAEAALAVLQDINNSEVPEPPQVGEEPQPVLENIQAQELNIVDLGEDENLITSISLNPGETRHFFLPTTLETGKLMLKLNDVSAELPSAEQNQFFGDGLFLTVLDAPTSINDILIDERLDDGMTDLLFPIMLPQNGIVRIGVMGDWTNAGKVMATLEITSMTRELPDPFGRGRIRDEEVDDFEFEVSQRTKQLNFELSWNADWGAYPPHDLDLLLIDPDDNVIVDGATLDSPERLSIDDPRQGEWRALVMGYMLHGYKDRYELRITDQDGRVLERGD